MLWIFDFDGTLIDSEKTIKECYLMTAKEFVPHRINFIKEMLIGPTLDETIKLIITNKDKNLIDNFKERFKNLYDDKLIFQTKMYPKVNSTLHYLFDKGDELCIATNKRSKTTHKLISYFGWEKLFSSVNCMDEQPKAKTKSDLSIFKNINKEAYKNIFFVGDTLSDGNAAMKNNINFIRANYGYGNSQDWEKIKIYKSIFQFNEIITLIK